MLKPYCKALVFRAARHYPKRPGSRCGTYKGRTRRRSVMDEVLPPPVVRVGVTVTPSTPIGDDAAAVDCRAGIGEVRCQPCWSCAGVPAG